MGFLDHIYNRDDAMHDFNEPVEPDPFDLDVTPMPDDCESDLLIVLQEIVDIARSRLMPDLMYADREPWLHNKLDRIAGLAAAAIRAESGGGENVRHIGPDVWEASVTLSTAEQCENEVDWVIDNGTEVTFACTEHLTAMLNSRTEVIWPAMKPHDLGRCHFALHNAAIRAERRGGGANALHGNL